MNKAVLFAALTFAAVPVYGTEACAHRGDVANAPEKTIRDMDRLEQCFLACTVEQAREARAVVPEISICNMSRQGRDRVKYVDLTIAEDCDYIQLHRGNGLKGMEQAMERLRGAGVRVNYYGSDDPETIRALRSVGVDYILTDALELCVRVLGETAQ